MKSAEGPGGGPRDRSSAAFESSAAEVTEDFLSPILRRMEGRAEADIAMRVCDVVLGTVTLGIAFYAGYLGWQGRLSPLLVGLNFAVPIFNVLWSSVSASLPVCQGQFVRTLVGVPLVMGIYVLGYDTFERMWLPMSTMSSGTSLVIAMQTRRLVPPIAVTLAYCVTLPLVMYALGDSDPGLTLIHTMAILAVGLLLASVGALLGRALVIEREQRAEADHQRKRAETAREELAAAQAQLVDAARNSGMAEIAEGVLHNVGNVMTSVTVSAESIRRSLSAIPSLDRAAALLQDQSDLATFWASEQGRVFPAYLAKLSSASAAAAARSKEELDGLRTHLEHIQRIISRQQRHVRAEPLLETFSVEEILHEALTLEQDSVAGSDVAVMLELEDVPPLHSDRHQLLQVLVNLIRNARQATLGVVEADRRIQVRVRGERDRVQFCVEDNGHGFDAETHAKLFRHGYTTRADGNGFGLHMSALSVRELGGHIRAESRGPGQGATFRVEIPRVFGAAFDPPTSEKQGSEKPAS